MNPLKRTLLIFTCLIFSNTTLASDAINTGWFNNTAIKGYDTVAYFTEKKPVKGSKKFQHTWQEATWHFSGEEHLALFKNNPEKYAPQYGGYCAYAVAQGDLAGIDPSQFTVMNKKLYLNYNRDIQQKWLKKPVAYINQADQNWPKVLNN